MGRECFLARACPSASIRLPIPASTFKQWLADNPRGAADSVISGTRELAGQPTADTADIAGILFEWLNSDVKAEPLKTAQGSSAPKASAVAPCTENSSATYGRHLRHGTMPAFRYMCSHRVPSANQQDWFAYARGGELASLISGWFDLTVAGPQAAKVPPTTGLPKGLAGLRNRSCFCPTIPTNSTQRFPQVGRSSVWPAQVSRIRHGPHTAGSLHLLKSTLVNCDIRSSNSGPIPLGGQPSGASRRPQYRRLYGQRHQGRG